MENRWEKRKVDNEIIRKIMRNLDKTISRWDTTSDAKMDFLLSLVLCITNPTFKVLSGDI